MLTGGSTQVRLDGLGGRLGAEVVHARAQCKLLREACSLSRRRAALAQDEAARICAISRRSRGELVRAGLPRDASCGMVASRLVEEHLGAATAAEVEALKVVVSELANNAFLHGKGKIELRASSRRGRARIEVVDEGDAADFRAGRREAGHGLEIVRSLSLAWGVRGPATHVWAELPSSSTARRPPVDAAGTDRPSSSWVTWMSRAEGKGW